MRSTLVAPLALATGTAIAATATAAVTTAAAAATIAAGADRGQLLRRFARDRGVVGEAQADAAGEYPPNMLKRALKDFLNPNDYKDQYGLRCYQDRTPSGRLTCYGKRDDSEYIVLYTKVPPYAEGDSFPAMQARWYRLNPPDGLAVGLSIALVIGYVSARCGLWWGNWMSRVQR